MIKMYALQRKMPELDSFTGSLKAEMGATYFFTLANSNHRKSQRQLEVNIYNFDCRQKLKNQLVWSILA